MHGTHLSSFPRAWRPEQDGPDAVVTRPVAVLLGLGRRGSGGGRHHDAYAVHPSHEAEVRREKDKRSCTSHA